MQRYKHIARLLQRQTVTGLCRRASTTNGGRETGNEDGEGEDPIRRTFRLLGNDMRKVKEFFVPKDPVPFDEEQNQAQPKQSKFNFKGAKVTNQDEFQTHCDVLIIGGGGMGSSIAYWLKHRARDGLNVVVVEKDETYAHSATWTSVGGLTQQFSLPENVEMSLFAADFLRENKEFFGETAEPIPLNFSPHGHLVLASEQGAEILKRTSQLQNELGARNELLSPNQLAARFPWLNTNGVALACHGLEKEGSFDSFALLANYKRSALGYGAHYVHGEVVDFVYKNHPDITVVGDEASNQGGYEGLDKVIVQLPDGSRPTIKFALCVIAGGAESGAVAQLARIGRGAGMLAIPLPLESRKRYTYVIDSQAANAPGMAAPLIQDPNGTFCRRDGLTGHYICGRHQHPRGDVSGIDPRTYFEQEVRPNLVNRVPAFENATLVDTWTGSCAYNLYDDNGIVGPHPYYNNLYLATGFSAHGMQQTPAVGRAISELIMDGQFRTIDLTRLSFDRLVVDKPMYELNIV